MQKWGLRVAGFVLVAGVIVGIEAIIIGAMNSGSYRVSPKGLGWITVPVIFGLWGASWFANRSPDAYASAKINIASSLPKRIFLATTLCWIVGLWVFLFAFDPFDGYWSNHDWETAWKATFIPPVILAFALVVFWKTGFFGPSKPSTSNAEELEHCEDTIEEATLPHPPVDIDDFTNRLKLAKDRIT